MCQEEVDGWEGGVIVDVVAPGGVANQTVVHQLRLVTVCVCVCVCGRS